MKPIRDVIAELNGVIDTRLDTLGVRHYEPTPERSPAQIAYVLARVSKVATEAGEVLEALEGPLGLNFRKPQTDTRSAWDHVGDELLDVAVTALLAYAAIFQPQDAMATLDEHLRVLHHRAKTLGVAE